ncbi:hypothetical protein MUA19_00205 [Staphylococcus chromogenes]|uniref:hypothetical protein n=1 Tax=Staphylococcus chromogenes TaxID=46126 RepID=UPI0021D2875E|nr:hypothetical protein [Staphylococcus chromogenes]UXS67892.1 hypothetical protein MUA19_00205 [Staphylococcus chromogenes]
MNSIGLIEKYKEFKKIIEERFSVPIHYVIFGILLVIYYLHIPIDKLISFIDKETKFEILRLLSIIYNNLFLLIIIIFIIIIIIIVFFDKMKMNRFFPADTEYIDGTRASVSYIFAITRLIKIVILFFTNYWIYYFLALVLINDGDFIYLSESSIFFNQILMFINIIILIYYILRALFVMRTSNDELIFRINKIELEDDYIILNEKNKYLIVKPKFRNSVIYYLLKIDDIYIDSKVYKVINKSSNLDEIIYHFEYLFKSN